MPADNQAMLLTPTGASAIAVVRLRGPAVAEFLAGHFSGSVAPLRCVHGNLRDGEVIIDDPVVVLHAGGCSADINLHGGPWVIASTLELLARSGFSVIAPPAGETPLDLADGDTILEREVFARLPLARTDAGLGMLLAQPAAWGRFISSHPSADAIREVLDDRCLWNLLHAPRVAIVGAPNVGKSTLANRLFEQDRSITADLPGTTRDWIGEIANIDGLPVMLVDTPGLRQTDDFIEQAAINQSRAVIEGADLLLVVRDTTTPWPDEQNHSADQRILRVHNKADLPNSAAGEADGYTVATTGKGVDELRRLIRERLGCADLTPNRPRCWTIRQRDILIRALSDQAVLGEL